MFNRFKKGEIVGVFLEGKFRSFVVDEIEERDTSSGIRSFYKFGNWIIKEGALVHDEESFKLKLEDTLSPLRSEIKRLTEKKEALEKLSYYKPCLK